MALDNLERSAFRFSRTPDLERVRSASPWIPIHHAVCGKAERPGELPHVSQIAGIEPPAKLRIEPTREIFEHRIAARCALPAALLLLDDFLADFAVSRWLPNGLPFSGGPVSGSPVARPC